MERSEVLNISARQERNKLRTRASLGFFLPAALIFATFFLTYQNDWVSFGARMRNMQAMRQLRLIAKQEATDGPTYNSATFYPISLVPSVPLQPMQRPSNLTQPFLGKPTFMVPIPKLSQEPRQTMTVSTRQGECPEERSVVEYYDIFFEPFDTSIVSDSLLESAFRGAYNDNVDEEGCQAKVISVKRIFAPMGAVLDGGLEPALITTERMQFLVTFSQFNDSGLFSAPLARASFISTLNEILILEGLPIFVLSVRSSADPANSQPGLADQSPFPTPEPTSSVTRRPTMEPSRAPVKIIFWGRQPSESPSQGPADVSTMAPQNKVESTSNPTVTSSCPTQRPTRSPTPRPDASLVDTPTSGPAERPSTTSDSLPTESPVVSLPAVSPSIAPSESPDYILREPELKSVQMVLTGVSLLSSRSQRVWTEATATAIEGEVTSFLNKQLKSANAQVTLISQNPRQRNLQDAPFTNQSTTVIASNLGILFDVKISIRTILLEDHNIRRYVGAALDTAVEKQLFMDQLQASGETAFQNLTSIQLILPSLPSEKPLQPGSNDSESISTGMLIGIIVIAVAAIGFCGAGLVVLARQSQTISQTSDSGQATKSLREYHGDGVMVNVVERPDGGDVSTLGDPIGQGTPAPPVDSSVAEETASLPYDFKVASHRLPSLGESASYSFSDASSRVIDVQTDDDTLDAQYFNEGRIEVEAPAGMLGLVLETDSEGVAAVYNMKQSSPLVDRIKIGDKLMSVDRIDVTAMPIKSVMEVIASKQHNKVRAFIFCRPSRASMLGGDSAEVDA